MPNVENIRRVIDAIRTGDGHPEIGFNMRTFTPEPQYDYSDRGCGTAMCIGGWAFTLATGRRGTEGDDFEPAVEWLGLDDYRAETLFYPNGMEGWNATADHAIAVLEHLIATGEVDWSALPPSVGEQ